MTRSENGSYLLTTLRRQFLKNEEDAKTEYHHEENEKAHAND